MKKTICLLAVLLIACGLLAGCAPDSSSEETQEAPSGEIVESSPAVAFPAMEGIGSDPLNALNEGYAVLSGGALYYADRQNGGNIWRSDPDGGNAQMLAEGSFRNLNVSGGRIFFTGWSGIYFMPVDGGQPQTVREGPVKSLFVLDEWLYYTTYDEGGNQYIRRMRADGSGDMLLTEDIGYNESFQIHDGWLYYLQSAEDERYDNLYKTTLDGSESVQVSDAPIAAFLIYEDHIYYVDWEKSPYGLQKMALDGMGQQEIYDRSVSLYAAAEGWIYLNSKPRGDVGTDLYRIRLDGSELSLVTEGHCFTLNVAGDWLFFTTNDEEYRISRMRLDGSERGFVNE